MEYSEFLSKNAHITSNITLQCAGKRENALNHSFGPAARENYYIILLRRGSGTLTVGKRTYRLVRGSLFVCYPNRATAYKADAGSVWDISWISVNGDEMNQILLNIGLSVEKPLIEVENFDEACEFLSNIYRLTMDEDVRSSIEAVGLTYGFLSVLTPKNCYSKAGEGYADKALKYLKHNSDREISVEEVAAYVGLDRAYFSKLFKRKTGLSPKQALTSYRMEKAARLIINTTMSICEVALSVGYADSLYFSRLFRKFYGVCPSKYSKADK